MYTTAAGSRFAPFLSRHEFWSASLQIASIRGLFDANLFLIGPPIYIESSVIYGALRIFFFYRHRPVSYPQHAHLVAITVDTQIHQE